MVVLPVLFLVGCAETDSVSRAPHALVRITEKDFRIEVKPRRVGGATYQVPIEANPERQQALALRWLVDFADARKGQKMDYGKH